MRISDWSSDVCSSDLLILADIKPGNGAVEQCLKRIDMLARPMLAFRAGVKAAYGFMDKRLLSIEQAGAEIIPVDAIGDRSPRKALTDEVGAAGQIGRAHV